jgi:hypothetical protein
VLEILTNLILDTCVGSAMMYHHRQDLIKDILITMDVRKGDFIIDVPSEKKNRIVKVHPTILADMRFLPFRENVFDVLICDPPHFRFGKTSYMFLKYGAWNESERIPTIYKANIEFSRVLKSTGTIVLKIMSEKLGSYENLFSNFIFYLPIHIFRSCGKDIKHGALWLIGIKK